MASACAQERQGLLSGLLCWLGQSLPSSSISQAWDAEKAQPLPFPSLGRFLRKMELEGCRGGGTGLTWEEELARANLPAYYGTPRFPFQ